MKASRGEIKICEILTAAGLPFIEEYSFPDLLSHKNVPLRFDFAVFDDEYELLFLIEYQGVQHYEPKSKFGGYVGLRKQQYNDMMNAYAARNYNRFGTLNATPSAYITDEYKRDAQRQMDDLAYNKAVNYENLINNELQRRYNTLDMFHNLYQYGNTPHSVDIDNWNTRNTNKSMAWNAQNASSSGMGGLGSILSALGTASGAFAGGIQ